MNWNCTYSQIDSTHNECTTKYVLLWGESLLIADQVLLAEDISANTYSVCCTHIQYIHLTYHVAALLWATTPTHNYFTHLAECITLDYGLDLKGQDFQPHGELKREEQPAILNLSQASFSHIQNRIISKPAGGREAHRRSVTRWSWSDRRRDQKHTNKVQRATNN